MKKLLMFSLVAAAFFAACQPKDANTTTASVATPEPTPEAAIVPKPKFITAAHELKTVNCEMPLDFPFIKSLSSNDAAALENLQANLSKLYFGKKVGEGQITKELSALCSVSEEPTSRNKILFNQNFLSIERQLNAEMDEVKHHVFDLSTGEAVELSEMLDNDKLQKAILEGSSAVKEAKKASPSSKIIVKTTNIWLTEKGLSMEIMLVLTPDDDDYCDGDGCFATYEIPMAKAKEIAVAGSRLATALANF